MKIKIISIKDSLICFRSKSGEGYAKWSGEIPLTGHTYDVEVDIDDEFVWGENIGATDDTSTIEVGNGYNMIAVAEVVSYDEDGCLAVRLDESVIFLEVEGAPINVSGYIKLYAKDLKLFPINL